jgi:phenylacetate-coenzyme A ligase PaaK-like adenylate-forming protein
MSTLTMTTDERLEARHAAVRAALPGHLERLRWSRERIEAHQRERLRALLRHAREHSRFHAERLARVDPARVQLAELPTMTKADLMARFDDAVCDPRLTRAAVEAHLAATGPEASELPGGHIAMASGGSSGERGVFVLSRQAGVDYLLGLIRERLARMPSLDMVPPGGIPMAMVCAGSAVHATRALPSLYGGDLMAIAPIPATLPLPQIVDRLNAMQPPILNAYASLLAQLAEEQAAGRLAISPLSVSGSSEQFAPEARARAAAALGVPVVDQFGATEGVVGSTGPDDDVFVLASDLAIIELVDEENRPVPPGVPAAKALVTNLFNHAQPLIRYELTDRFVRHSDAAEHGHMRVTIEGRADDLLRYGDLVVHPLTLRSVLVSEPSVIEYQVRQTARGAHVDVIAPGGVDARPLAERLAASLARAGLAEPEVTVARVSELRREPATGKAKRFLALS